MKKFFVYFLAGALLLSACGDGRPHIQESQEEPGAVLAEETESGTDAAAEADEAQEAQTTVEGKMPPVVKIDKFRAVRFADDGETELAEVVFDGVVLSGEGYEKAAESVERLLSCTQEKADEEVDELAGSAAEQYSFCLEDGYFFAPYSSEAEYSVSRLDTQVLSLKGRVYDYMGGAHGMYAEKGITIDLLSGVKLELPHLTDDIPGFTKKLQEILSAQLASRIDDLYEDYEAYLPEKIEDLAWYLDAAGIEIIFNPYEIAPYASGTIRVLIPYGEVAGLMKPEYCGLQGATVSELARDEVNTVEFQEGVGEGTIIVQNRMGSDDISQLVITVNGQENVIGDYLYARHAYFMRRPEGKSFLVFDIDWASDDYETFVYELTDGKFTLADSIGAQIAGGYANLESINFSMILQVLGTHSTGMEYTLTADGKLVPTGDRFEFTSHGESAALRTVRELPVTVAGQETSLPAGTGLWIVATDNAGTAWFRTEAGETGEIHYERSEEDYALLIDGRSEYDYFEDIPYAG